MRPAIVRRVQLALEHRHRRGNAITVGLLLLSTLGFGALAVDLGLIRVGGAQLQHTLDAAAFSGTQRLDGTTAGISAAIATATSVAASNPVLGSTVSLPSANVVAGTWDPVASTFVVWQGGPADAVNALRVNIDNRSIPAALGALTFGATSYTVDARSSTYRRMGADALGEAQCYLPFAVPACKVGSTNAAPTKFTFSPTPDDSIAWGLPSANPSSSAVNAQLEAVCGSLPIGIGDDVYINEGLHTTALKTIEDMLNGTSTTIWDTALYGPLPPRDGVSANTQGNSAVSKPRYGHTIEGAIPIVSGCGEGFTGHLPIEGFAWGVVYDVQNKTSAKNLFIQVDVTGEHDVWGPVDSNPAQTHDNVAGTGAPQFGAW